MKMTQSNEWFIHKATGLYSRIQNKSKGVFLLFFEKTKSVYSADGWHTENKSISKGQFDSTESAQKHILSIIPNLT